MKVIDDTIMSAILKMKMHLGTNIAIAEKFKCSPKHVGKIIKGEIIYFHDDMWERIKPLLRPYMESTAKSKEYKNCPFPSECPLLDKDMLRIVQYLSSSKNKVEKYQILSKAIAALAESTNGGDGGE